MITKTIVYKTQIIEVSNKLNADVHYIVEYTKFNKWNNRFFNFIVELYGFTWHNIKDYDTKTYDKFSWTFNEKDEANAAIDEFKAHLIRLQEFRLSDITITKVIHDNEFTIIRNYGSSKTTN